ncbi:MAG: CPBP family intramembrane metalloprotease [Candidatus Eremiobacteraeota bacterium]|nr:CPBP family intramembrane metalloprotease [Candidatus Eremiobacteraeota bacterium]
MTHLTLADAILLVALGFIAPAYSYYAGTRIARGRLGKRMRAYARTMLSWWLIASIMLFLWSRLGRPLASLGIAVSLDARSIAGAALCVVAIVVTTRQVSIVSRIPPESLAQLRSGFGRTLAVLPRSPAEYRLFLAVAVTAGICEELLYRGYFLAATSSFLTLDGAIAVGALAFGAGHAYQGARGMVRTSLAGILFSLLYVFTGSLLWPIVLHVTIDIHGGTIGYYLLREEQRRS